MRRGKFLLFAAVFMVSVAMNVCFAMEINPIRMISKLIQGEQPQNRAQKGVDAAEVIHGFMVENADAGIIRNRQDAMANFIRPELEKNPGKVYVVELVVPGSSINLEQPIDKNRFTPIGVGNDIWHAIATNSVVTNNVIRAYSTVKAKDYKRSKYLVARLVNGDLFWHEAPMPTDEVIKGHVLAAMTLEIEREDIPTASANPKNPQNIAASGPADEELSDKGRMETREVV